MDSKKRETILEPRNTIREPPFYDLILFQGENQIKIKIRECDIYSFIRDQRKGIKLIIIDLEKKECSITFFYSK